jgi:AmiR/NasT family two-component response regulator
VSTDARAHRLDVAGAEEGPHEHAVRRDEVVHIPDASTDRRWSTYAQHMLTEGVASAIVFPLDIDEAGTTVGLLAVYSPEPHLFDATDRHHMLERLVAEATRALALAARLANSQERSAHLEMALLARATIDQAIGILMAQNKCSAGEAFALLSKASQNRNVKLRRVARDIVAQVGGEEPEPTSHFRH